ncbi:uncharacterized protein LOC126563270 [Anopheles maculipalpis]|uniref:uncharacterized protein LOC126563270 n=1 Tax=Anopheles maculipalpis TaxID=1496333 RepID=UPI002158E1EB|nr:uncharacterized protein LOC126563270 [Anopheles maculipalpis]
MLLLCQNLRGFGSSAWFGRVSLFPIAQTSTQLSKRKTTTNPLETSPHPFDTYIILCNSGKRRPMIRSFWQRYKVVILFPALAFGSIAADYNYTRQWKKARLEHGQQQTQQA